MSDFQQESVMVFVDGGYIYKALRATLKDKSDLIPKVGLLKIAQEICNKRILKRIYYYNAYPPLYSDSDRYEKVQKLLWQIEQKTGSPPKIIGTKIKKLTKEGKRFEEIATILGITAEEIKAEIQYYKDKQQIGYYDSLSHKGIKVKLNKLKRDPERAGKYYQKGIDVFIASDMLSLAFRNAYDSVILISGDGDYVKVIEEIQELGKIVEVASFKYGKSWDLEKACDKYILLDPVVLKMCEPETT